MGYTEAGINSSFQITTTDASTTELTEISIGTNNTTWFDLLVIARSSTGVSALWRKQFMVKDISGTTTLVGSVLDLVTPIKDIGALLWSPSVTVSSGQVTINVNGEASTDIGWAAEYDVNGYKN